MTMADLDLKETLKRYGGALDERSHRQLAALAFDLEARAAGLRPKDPGRRKDGPEDEYLIVL